MVNYSCVFDCLPTRVSLLSSKIHSGDDTAKEHICNITCGDVNVNCLIDNNRKSLLDATLHSYSLSCIL